MQRHTAMPGKGHFTDTRKQTAIRAIMVGKNSASRIQFLYGRKESTQQGGTIKVRWRTADLLVYLRQCRTRQTIIALAKINQQQIRVALVGA